MQRTRYPIVAVRRQPYVDLCEWSTEVGTACGAAVSFTVAPGLSGWNIGKIAPARHAHGAHEQEGQAWLLLRARRREARHGGARRILQKHLRTRLECIQRRLK